MAETFVSLLETTTTGSLGTVGTNLFVDDTSRFPASPLDNFYITVFDPSFSSAAAAFSAGMAEIMRVTAKSGTSLTVVRGQEGTNAIAIGVGWQVIHVFGPTNISNKILTSSIVDGFAGGTSAPGSAENDKVLNERKVQMVTLPQGDGATGNVRWYRVATMPKNNHNEIHFSVHGANTRFSPNKPVIHHFQVGNLSATAPDISYSKIGTQSTTSGRVVVTDDGTDIGVYVAVNRHVNATVMAPLFINNRTANGSLTNTEIAQGSSIPASISADVIFDTSSDSPNMIQAFGSVLGGESIAWTPTDNSGAGLAFTGVTAEYAQSLNIYTVGVKLTYPANSDANTAQITGLPANPVGGVNYMFRGVSTATRFFALNTVGNRFYILDETGFLTNADLSGQNIFGSFTYIGV